MADTINVDLSTLEHILEHGLDPVLHRLDGCVPEISISPEMQAAAFAIYRRRIDSIVGPSELGSTLLAVK
ncbi:MAG: hypothetical protein WCG92_14235 [Hyphomicrobiales bacterium]